jgi:hypothetical protein
MPVAIAIGAAAAIGGVATVVSGNKAANAQKDAANASISEQQREYNQTREDTATARNIGNGALTTLGSVYGIGADGQPATSGAAPDYSKFYESPDYQFRLSEGQKAIDRSNSARGLLGSGANQKAQIGFAENTAAGGYNDWWSKLSGLAGIGQNATNTTVAAGQNTANNISSAYTAAGNARASSYLNTGSAINSTVNNLASVYAFNAGGGFKQPYGYGH